jgi:hypothetical protein
MNSKFDITTGNNPAQAPVRAYSCPSRLNFTLFHSTVPRGRGMLTVHTVDVDDPSRSPGTKDHCGAGCAGGKCFTTASPAPADSAIAGATGGEHWSRRWFESSFLVPVPALEWTDRPLEANVNAESEDRAARDRGDPVMARDGNARRTWDSVQRTYEGVRLDHDQP